MSITDKVEDVLQAYIGQTLDTSTIKRYVKNKYKEVAEGSIIPSDYCYNMINKDKKVMSSSFFYLEQVARGRYKVLGRNAKYNGPIWWKGKKVGESVGGVRHLSEKALDET